MKRFIYEARVNYSSSFGWEDDYLPMVTGYKADEDFESWTNNHGGSYVEELAIGALSLFDAQLRLSYRWTYGRSYFYPDQVGSREDRRDFARAGRFFTKEDREAQLEQAMLYLKAEHPEAWEEYLVWKLNKKFSSRAA